jgi:hypothetical protein
LNESVSKAERGNTSDQAVESILATLAQNPELQNNNNYSTILDLITKYHTMLPEKTKGIGWQTNSTSNNTNNDIFGLGEL